MRIVPFRGLHPDQDDLARMIAPPYDVIDTQAAKKLATHPDHFLHLTKPEIDHPADIHQAAADNLQRLLQRNILSTDDDESYYIYQMHSQFGVQTGLVCLVDLADSDHILIHELTQPDKEQSRVDLILAQQAQLSPIMLAYRSNSALKKLTTPTTEPLLQAELNHVSYRLWRIDQPQEVVAITQAFAGCDNLYIADGHHRYQATRRVAEQTGYARLFAICFPSESLHVMAYHRVCQVTTMRCDALLDKLRTFELTPQADAYLPHAPGMYGCYCQGQWYSFRLPDGGCPVLPLHELIIEPLLSITDPRRDERIDFCGGIDALDLCAAQVDQGNRDIAFTLFPTTLEQMMQVADNGELLPPKSTWFEPKLADGLIAYQYEE